MWKAHISACNNKNENKNFKLSFEFLLNRKFLNLYLKMCADFSFTKANGKDAVVNKVNKSWFYAALRQMALRFIHHNTYIEASLLELSKAKLLHGITFNLLASVWSIAKEKSSHRVEYFAGYFCADQLFKQKQNIYICDTKWMMKLKHTNCGESVKLWCKYVIRK